MAWFCAMSVSVRVILSVKVVWAATKDADVAEKVRTASIIVRNPEWIWRYVAVVALMYYVQLTL